MLVPYCFYFVLVAGIVGSIILTKRSVWHANTKIVSVIFVRSAVIHNIATSRRTSFHCRSRTERLLNAQLDLSINFRHRTMSENVGAVSEERGRGAALQQVVTFQLPSR